MDNKNYCTICGYDFKGNFPLKNQWNPFHAHCEFCPCCGIQTGRLDHFYRKARIYRKQWLDSRSNWFDKSKKPKYWSLEEQLKNIPEEELRNTNNTVYYCRVCGDDFRQFPAINENASLLPFSFCPCCGLSTEFNYVDEIIARRKIWLDNGAQWYSPNTPIPQDWNLEEQLKSTHTKEELIKIFNETPKSTLDPIKLLLTNEAFLKTTDYCRACGYDTRDYIPRGENSVIPASGERCSCCGVAIGFSDCTESMINFLESCWAEREDVWYKMPTPPNRNYKEQVKCTPSKESFTKEEPFYFCRVCGYDFGDFSPWEGPNGDVPSYVICSCCGAEAGYGDERLEKIRYHRKKWIENGYKWFAKKRKPENWDPRKQLKIIPERFL